MLIFKSLDCLQCLDAVGYFFNFFLAETAAPREILQRRKGWPAPLCNGRLPDQPVKTPLQSWKPKEASCDEKK